MPSVTTPESVILAAVVVLVWTFDLGAGSGRGFWAFRKPERHAPPVVADAGWARRRIDRFVFKRLSDASLRPNPPANPRTLARRLSFDLTGLPPTAAAIDAFVSDRSPGAYERLVDSLLSSPHYGEHFARLWLDVARYAEDQAHIVGNNQSLFYPNAYLYRDWVIAALNDDMPFDRFVELQLAADLAEPDSDRNLAALGFVGLGPKYYSRKALSVMADEWEDRVDTVTRGLMGLTVACARCHDHKYDPISVADYYGLAGVFASTEMYNRPLEGKESGKDGQAKNSKESIHIVREGKPHDLNVFIRGDVNSKGPVAKRRFIEVLSDGQPSEFHEGSGRLELARAIVDRDNPLAARVLVNRVWGAILGKPLVSTPSNFGTLGARPTHPALLDDLAVRFMESGWSIKWLVRELVLSATYRQSSRADARAMAIDPDNRWLSRMNRKRLGVESWRDALLAAGGRLELSVGGPSIEPQDLETRRRTVYSRVSRFELDKMLALFDFPDPNVHSASRTGTTTPTQKLFVLNSPFMVRQAEALARRLREELGASEQGTEFSEIARARIERVYRVLYGRSPEKRELELAIEYLGGTSKSAADDETRWRHYCQVLLASNEMLFVD